MLKHDFLLHGVNKLGVRQVHRADLAIRIGVEKHFDRANQTVQMWLVAQLGDMRHDFGSNAVQKAEAFIADGNRICRHACQLQFTQFTSHAAKDVGVQATAQALVRCHHNHTHDLGVVGFHEGVDIFRIGLAQIGSDVAHLFGIGPCSPHTFLSLTHFGDRDHLHGLGDLLRTFEVFDLAAYFLACCHKKGPSLLLQAALSERLLECSDSRVQFSFRIFV